MSRSLLWLALALAACAGPEGPAGPQGPEGPAGPQGPAGADGADGADGETVRTIDADTTWSSDTDVSGVWVVADGATLTIEPGVTVTLLPGSGLIVDGTLIATADEVSGEGVTFTWGTSSSVNNWGVVVGGTDDASDLDGATFHGVDLAIEGAGTASITGATFTRATLVVRSRATGFTVEDCTFEDNDRDDGDGLRVVEVPALTVTSSDFTNVGDAIVYDGGQAGAPNVLTATDLTFSNVDNGIVVGGGGDRHVATLSDITITGALTRGVDTDDTDLTATSLVISDTGLDAVRVVAGDADLTAVTVSATLGSCINAPDGALTLTTTNLSDCDTIGVRAGDGSTITAVEITNPGSYGIFGEGGLTASNVRIQDSGFTAIATNGSSTLADIEILGAATVGVRSNAGTLVATDVTVTGTRSTGFQVDSGALECTRCAVTNADGAGFSLDEASATLTDVSVRNAEGAGITADDSDVTVRGATIEDTRGQGVLGVGSTVSLSDVTVARCSSNAVQANYGALAVDGLTISDAIAWGVNGTAADLTIADLRVDRAVGGVASANGTLVLSDAIIADTFTSGVAVTNPRAAVQVDRTRVLRAGGNGIDIRGEADVANVSVVDPAGFGIYFESGVVERCEVLRAGNSSINVYGTNGPSTDTALVDRCVLADGVWRGVQGSSLGLTNNVIVSNSNITGHVSWAAFWTQTLENNYIFDNAGSTTADEGIGGTEDGTHDTSSDQTRNADVIVSMAEGPVSDAGPAQLPTL